MYETTFDILLVLGRIITILPLLLFITLFMGKRAIGELPIFDFLIVVILGAVVGADIADPNIHHLPTAIAIVAVGILQRIIANLKISNRKLGKWLTFEPTIVVHNGQILNSNLKKVRYSIDNLLQMLREKDVFNLSDVEIALIEPNGAISVLKKSKKLAVTIEDLNLSRNQAIAFPVVVEGEIYSDVLRYFKQNDSWLLQQLAKQGVTNLKDIFIATIDHQQQLHISLKDQRNIIIPPIRH
ncbi:DUF421 domain-containing protein [Halalkalibacter krulwichiae]|uniref:YetF C-terminal domain-containing protein n=1 Tax=Halalkalibacter krulwichiae TaxID=199441 RepID=A0A1X9MJJ4_9BACI|nr:DUF421 domain-containing protein [Halalkalibacter krulwichiae]ARK32860.1 hypothetical protein BkAM31D_25005 [Halalkalibacter krulwichiae]